MPHTHVIHQNNLNLQTAKTKHIFLFNTSSVSERVDIVSKKTQCGDPKNRITL